ncbi:SWI/SNF chromatin-remodeling complex subunit [Rhizophlyctis rosea]|uniref:SWI/SNF chromatin-remodeling complex subunit n=1 Tax=Rhizophlyctis rosea TaxID=64517 RepID=A0AAD5S6C9_9FUNG|nr:SWI/SNF chromatin-remodeling complex subunit [Rhizophlyctis rosea]
MDWLGGAGQTPMKSEMVLSATREMPLMKPMVHVGGDWRCENCGRTAQQTPLLRKGPLGEKTLCNACGLYWLKNSYSRPLSPGAHIKPRSPIIGVKAELPQTPLMRHDPQLRILGSGGVVGPSGRHASAQPDGDALGHGHEGVDYSQFPAWVKVQRESLMSRYPNDLFDVVTKGPGGPMRIKCLDCPGKLYQLGPDQSLGNFEVHLRNRHHRANVNSRVGLPRRPVGLMNGDGGAWNGDGDVGNMVGHAGSPPPPQAVNGAW